MSYRPDTSVGPKSERQPRGRQQRVQGLVLAGRIRVRVTDYGQGRVDPPVHEGPGLAGASVDRVSRRVSGWLVLAYDLGSVHASHGQVDHDREDGAEEDHAGHESPKSETAFALVG